MADVVEVKEIEKESEVIVSQAESLVIKDDGGLQGAKDFVKNCNALIKKVKETFEPMKKKAKAAHQEICDKESEHLSGPQKAKKMAEDAIGGYMDYLEEQAKIKAEEEEKARAKEIEKAEKRIAKHLEDYKDIESQITEIEKQLQDENISNIDTEVLQKQLSILEKKRDNKQETIENNEQRIEEASVSVSTASRPSFKGLGGGRKVRIPTVINKGALINAVASGILPLDLLDVNEGKLKKYVNDFPNLRPPGVSIESKRDVRVRG